MSDFTRWGHDPVPSRTDAANVPADLLALGNSVDARTVHVAVDEAERDANFSDVPSGHLVTSPSGLMWRKTDSGWLTSFYDTGWQAFSATWATGFTDIGSYRRSRDGHVQQDLLFSYSGVTLPTDSRDNVADVLVLTLPAGWTPTHAHRAIVYGDSSQGTALVRTSGALYIATMAGDIRDGAIFEFSLKWMV